MRRLLPLAVLALPLALIFCEDDDSVIPVTSAAVQAVDDCDSVSFNAALGPGTCQKAGTTTFDAFANELSASGRVASWAFVPTTLKITVRGIVQVTNRGGERHTFTNRAASTYRGIYDFADLERSLYIQTTGQSGNAFSPFYRSFAERWAKVDYIEIPTRRDVITRTAIGTWRLTPQ